MIAASTVLLFAVGSTSCTAVPTPSPTPGFGPATWVLDSAFPVPTANSTELHILVWERACAGGSAATGRMSTPLIEYAADTITITIKVRGLGGVQSCPSNQATPSTVRLAEPVGNRDFLDGGRDPVAAPTFPY